jgi:hypothetical protein
MVINMSNEIKINLGKDILADIKKNEKAIKTKESKLARSGQITLSASNEPFTPEIMEDDNILVKIVKEILMDKKISTKELNFKDIQEESNFKRSLRVHNKMSVEKFTRWMELLDVEWKVVHQYDFKNRKKSEE